MAYKLTVLAAGATGMLGTKIVSVLLDKDDPNVWAMVRQSTRANGKTTT